MKTLNHTQRKMFSYLSAPAYTAIVTWILTFCLSCWISIATTTDPAKAYNSSVAERLLGESKVALTWYFYHQADTYFHGGWEYRKNESFRGSIYQNIAGEISPRYHVHLSGSEVKEIMPWLHLATLTDPHDIRIFFDSAFWLAHDAKRPDLAEQVLLSAQIENPFNYQIQIERGRILLIQNKIEEAKRAFDAGLAFWPSNYKTNSETAMDGKARLLLYRALLHEADGERKDAVSNLQEIFRLFPERTYLHARIRDLKEGKEPSLLASKVWSDMLKTDTSKQSEKHCSHPGEE